MRTYFLLLGLMWNLAAFGCIQTPSACTSDALIHLLGVSAHTDRDRAYREIEFRVRRRDWQMLARLFASATTTDLERRRRVAMLLDDEMPAIWKRILSHSVHALAFKVISPEDRAIADCLRRSYLTRRLNYILYEHPDRHDRELFQSFKRSAIRRCELTIHSEDINTFRVSSRNGRNYGLFTSMNAISIWGESDVPSTTVGQLLPASVVQTFFPRGSVDLQRIVQEPGRGRWALHWRDGRLSIQYSIGNSRDIGVTSGRLQEHLLGILSDLPQLRSHSRWITGAQDWITPTGGTYPSGFELPPCRPYLR